MNIDWSKAPEGATHHLFYRDGSISPSFAYECEDRFRDCIGEEYIMKSDVDSWIITPRIVSEWTGTGLPAVGTVCEVMVGGLPSVAFDWEECTIFLINDGADGKPQVCTRDHRGDLAIYYPGHDAVHFRPIRTPEQIAAEERIAYIARMVGVCKYPGSTATRNDCADLYDAGLRFKDDAQ